MWWYRPMPQPVAEAFTKAPAEVLVRRWPDEPALIELPMVPQRLPIDLFRVEDGRNEVPFMRQRRMKMVPRMRPLMEWRTRVRPQVEMGMTRMHRRVEVPVMRARLGAQHDTRYADTDMNVDIGLRRHGDQGGGYCRPQQQ